MKLCAIIPSHDHCKAIAATVAHLRKQDIPVFVIDDGSGRPARDVIAALHDPANQVVVLRLEPNRGKGGAVMEAFRLASRAGYTHAIQIDADGQHDLAALPRLMEAARAYPEAVVSGHPSFDASMPRGRRIGRWITHFWVWIETLSTRIPDSMCGFRIYPLAPVMELMAERKLGTRMDFDTEIMVRLFWRGVAPVMVPVDVIYPEDNISNFRLLRDNLRITAMHTKLVAEMIFRLPAILRNRPPSPEAGSDPAQSWAALGERGAFWGLETCIALQKRLGRKASLILTAPAVLYFCLAGTEQREGARQFLGRVLNRPVGWVDCFTLFMSFAAKTLDSYIAWGGGYSPESLVAADPAGLAALMSESQGGMVVVSHLGNVEASRALIAPELRARFTLLVHTRHATNYNRMMARLFPESASHLVQVTEIGPETVIALKERIERGDWLAIAGDRTPVHGGNQISRVPFLGAPAAFPNGPWLMAELLRCPVYLLFCLREGDHWRITLEPFAERVELRRGDRAGSLRDYAARYADRLAEYARRAPFQWYNFYDFWAC